MDRIRIVLVDDHLLFAETLRQFLESQYDMEVIGAVATADEALVTVGPLCPDVILLDITLPGRGGIGVLPLLKKQCPDSRVIMVTVHDDPAYLRAALAAGATGYVVKTSVPAVLLEAIRTIPGTEPYVDPSLRHVSIKRTKPIRGPAATPFARLSERERQVLQLLAQGLRYQAVAEKIGVKVKTVETYRNRLKAKLGFTNREDMMRLAIEMGILSSQDEHAPK